MKSLISSKTLKLLGASAITSTLMEGETIGNQFFGIFSSKKLSDEKTKTYIWGNGFAQVSPTSGGGYANFEPKLIKNFDGKETPYMKKIFFGKGVEAGIDVNGDVHAWKMEPLHSAVRKGKDYNKREGVKMVDKEGDNIQVAFTKKFLWVLKKNGTVYQYPINLEVNNKNFEVNEFSVSDKKRKIDSLSKIKQIQAGEDHFVAINEDGKVFTMGNDTLGQCGLGDFGRGSGGPFYERRVRTPEEVDSKVLILNLRSPKNYKNFLRF